MTDDDSKAAKKVAKIQRRLRTLATGIRGFREEIKEAPRLEEIFQIRMPPMPEHEKLIEVLNNDYLTANNELAKLIIPGSSEKA